jgi:hypothetical protein
MMEMVFTNLHAIGVLVRLRPGMRRKASGLSTYLSICCNLNGASQTQPFRCESGRLVAIRKTAGCSNNGGSLDRRQSMVLGSKVRKGATDL